jgi:hypothetical protein
MRRAPLRPGCRSAHAVFIHPATDPSLRSDDSLPHSPSPPPARYIPSAPAVRARPAPEPPTLRTALVYLLLVGLPAAGVAAILYLGEALTPPPRVGGVWAVDAPGAAGCLDVPPGWELTLHQSGRWLEAELPTARRERLRATLDPDGAFRGRRDLPATDRCPAGELRLVVRPVAAPGAPSPPAPAAPTASAVVGLLERPGCPNCLSLPFHATRTAPAPPTRGAASH